MSGTNRRDINPGDFVKILMKENQPSGKLTEGYVKDILSKFPEHQLGIKVRLDTGQVGRVKEVFKNIV